MIPQPQCLHNPGIHNCSSNKNMHYMISFLLKKEKYNRPWEKAYKGKYCVVVCVPLGYM